MCPVTDHETPLTGLGWPASREAATDVSRETSPAGLGWPVSRETGNVAPLSPRQEGA